MAKERFTKLPDDLVLAPRDKVPPSVKNTYAVIRRLLFHGCDTLTVAAIAARAGLQDRQTRTHVKVLESEGLLERVRTCGKPDTFRLPAEAPTPAENCRGTPAENCRGLRQGVAAINCRGQGLPPYKGLEELGEREEEAPSPPRKSVPKTPSFPAIAELSIRDVRTSLEYQLGEHPDDPRLRALADWAPGLVGEYFERREWRQPKDTARGGSAWQFVVDLARAGATEAEAAEAMRYVEDHPIERKFSRPDHRWRIIDRIKRRRQLRSSAAATAQRIRQAAEALPAREPAPEFEGLASRLRAAAAGEIEDRKC